MKMESRITDRFKYKTVNKYSLLLQALVTYQEREMEVISHLKTKKKILNALHTFVKQEAEAAAKAVIGMNSCFRINHQSIWSQNLAFWSCF